jgi:hypothetical protein
MDPIKNSLPFILQFRIKIFSSVSRLSPISSKSSSFLIRTATPLFDFGECVKLRYVSLKRSANTLCLFARRTSLNRIISVFRFSIDTTFLSLTESCCYSSDTRYLNCTDRLINGHRYI